MNKTELIGKQVTHRILGIGVIDHFDDEKGIFYVKYEKEDRLRVNRYPDDILCGDVFKIDETVYPMVSKAFLKCKSGQYVELSRIDEITIKCRYCGKEFYKDHAKKIVFLETHGLIKEGKCKDCALEMKRQKIERERRIQDWGEFYFFRSLMGNSKPCDAKKHCNHDTYAMSVQ